MASYKVTVEGHDVEVTWDDNGIKLYIDGDFRDRYQGDTYSRDWKTLVRGSIVRNDGRKAAVEFQIRASGIFSVFLRFVFANKEILKWKG